MNIIPFPGLLPNLSLIQDQDHFFESVKEDYHEFARLGYFLAQGDPAFYVFRIQSPGQEATGLICSTLVEDYLQGRILKHEKTIHHKQQVQMDLLQERMAAVKPVLLVHRQEPEIKQWLRAYTRHHQPILQVDFSDQETHILWEISEASAVAAIQQLFREKLSAVAIADGHHRLSSFASLWKQHSPRERAPFASVLSAYFPEDELNIAAFHRLVELPAAADPLKLLRQIRNLGSLEKMSLPQLPTHKHQMSIVLQSVWYSFEWDTEYLKTETPLRPVLDVDLLDQRILGPLFGVVDIQADSRLRYIEGMEDPQQLLKALKNLPAGIAFILYPIHPRDFLQIARLGIMLTPKATFFLPRLKNGLVVQPIRVV